VSYMVWMSLAFSVGIGFGPIVSSSADMLVGPRGTRGRAAVPVLGLSITWLGVIALIFLVWPSSTAELLTAKAEADQEELHESGGGATDTDRDTSCKSGGTEDAGPDPSQVQKDADQGQPGQRIECLSSRARCGLWWESLLYGAERALIVAALEAATVLILETEFGWSTTAAGYATGCSFLASIPVTLLARYGLHAGWIAEASLLAASAGLACASSALIFPAVGRLAQVTGARQAWLLLASDCVTFANGFLAGGVMQGFGLRSSERGTFRSEKNYIAVGYVLQNGAGRLLGPVLARWCVSQGGRTMYAAIQCLISAIGFATCLLVSAKIRFSKA